MMTGTGAGAIDFDWLMEHLRVRDIEIEPAGGGEPDRLLKVPTFCLDDKALPAAEQFLLSRYTLHEQVYFHKTTRCVERMIGALLGKVALRARAGGRQAGTTGLDRDHPLIRYYRNDGGALADYMALDDAVVMGAIERMTQASDAEIADLARRPRERRLYKTLDLRVFGHDEGAQRRAARKIDRNYEAQLGTGVHKDEGAAISIYTQIGGDDDKIHKRLHILDEVKGPVEITATSPLAAALARKTQFTRYYFADVAARDAALPRREST